MRADLFYWDGLNDHFFISWKRPVIKYLLITYIYWIPGFFEFRPQFVIFESNLLRLLCFKNHLKSYQTWTDFMVTERRKSTFYGLHGRSDRSDKLFTWTKRCATKFHILWYQWRCARCCKYGLEWKICRKFQNRCLFHFLKNRQHK